ncbi:MAG TPA: M28 family peptidase [Candidatus Thermoplasmatota archaeon]|nr:M28 family peptidase [Candidatus Thermoplasmatota archaeon]
MSRVASVVTALLAAATAFAGCVAPPEDVAPESQAPGAVGAVGASYVPPTGKGAVGYLAGYTMTHPNRIASSPDTMAKARADLVAELQGFGLEVVEHKYSDTGTNILAIQNGTTTPDEWIVLSAHYDTAKTTLYGAWDDGAGVAMLLELARAGATRSHNHTIVYAFFDEEESGLLGSKAFVEEYQALVTFAANLNFDPPGLNWPCADAQGPLPVKVIFNDEKVGKDLPGYAALRDAVLAGLDAAQVPEDVRDFSPGIPVATLNGEGLRGTSDHKSFDDVDVPNVFIGSAPTSAAGPVAGMTYLLHTPIDTQQQMEVRCGGADLLEQAFQVEITVVVEALSILDAHAA